MLRASKSHPDFAFVIEELSSYLLPAFFNAGVNFRCWYLVLESLPLIVKYLY